MDNVQDAQSGMGTSVHYVPPGCTGVAQPLDIGVMATRKTHLCQTCAQAAVLNALPENSEERWRYMFNHTVHAGDRAQFNQQGWRILRLYH
ncbi:hypothetical protein PI124_g9306 [Phytophthora idaei]|nr:hypothetical protein PI125_g19570 [Phytophthora idaei]KAG3142070.1 hypothetical protein PI126_g15210 [Phytophthora idaei]KAG3245966.1 hypothetical protein PI124_g9306 [Phytophthora idaei]